MNNAKDTAVSALKAFADARKAAWCKAAITNGAMLRVVPREKLK
jgi:hypothetical protein